ncbi:TLC domain-containing protein 5-like isoform X1 [Asterias rubens]|uniref:TLC domain-containing protein 5-like isoform X1 n=1 Tax=Asterias rubens TaxID=7604 RepID=UPI001455D26A|nr:TLC domain-containing protein 5-like isoform X1 [Asterias rubens]
MDELSREYILLLTIISTTIWSALYGVLCYSNPTWSCEWNCRIVTLIHALVVITMSSTFGILYNPWPFTHPGGKSNILEVFTMVVCLGYFMYDFCWCVWFYDSSTAVMLAHHLVSIAGISASLMSGYSGTEIGTCIFLGELSNPMLQLRYFMRQSGIKDGILYELNELTFLMTFIVCRAGIGSYLTFCHVMHPLPHVFFKIGGVALYVVSWIFIVQLLTIVFHKYSCRSSHDVKHAIKKDN